ncbi:hypothetical protein FQN60_016529, partial [Etheostoma spectabile]
MVDFFTTYEDLKITAPGMSRQAFVSMLEGRTKLFEQWMETANVSKPGPDGCIDGVFLANDPEVSFVDYIHGTTGHGKGDVVRVTGWQHESLSTKTASFTYCPVFCSDVVCKYCQHLRRIVDHCLELEDLCPVFSIVHAKAHSWMCELKWGGCNQGAGTTIREKVKQVNAYLSRPAICSKDMSKAAFVNMDISFGPTVQRITEATKDLEKLTAELSLQQDTVQQWVSDVQQWSS